MQSGPSFTATDRPFQGAILTRSRWCAVMGIIAAFGDACDAVFCSLEPSTSVGTHSHSFVVCRGRDVERTRCARTTGGSFSSRRSGCLACCWDFWSEVALAAVGVSLQALLRESPGRSLRAGSVEAARRWASPSRSCSESAPQSSRCRSYPSADFAGSLAALLVIYRMAASHERLPIHSVLLAGVILNAIFFRAHYVHHLHHGAGTAHSG